MPAGTSATFSAALQQPEHSTATTGMEHAALQRVQDALCKIFDPATAAAERRVHERLCNELAPPISAHAARLLSDPGVHDDPQLSWYIVNSFKQQALARYWHLQDAEKEQLLRDVQTITHQVSSRSPQLHTQVSALHATVLCPAASDGLHEAVHEMQQTIAAVHTVSSSGAQRWPATAGIDSHDAILCRCISSPLARQAVNYVADQLDW